jgi:uncharacterized protein with FMN-binding domain
MRRTPIVIGATIAGLAGVLAFHTKSASLTLGSLPGVSTTRSSPTSSVATGSPTGHGSSGASSPPTSSSTTSPPPGTSPTTSSTTTTTTPRPTSTTTAPPTTVPSATQSATGALVNYNYGILSVSVTASGKRITKVSIASLDDGGSFRSQSIDQQSIPILEEQALQAQSANIQGVSGASYTSAGFEKSLQSALGKLGLS